MAKRILIVHAGFGVNSELREALAERFEEEDAIYTADMDVLYQTLRSYQQIDLIVLEPDVNLKTVKKSYKGVMYKPYTISLSARIRGPKIIELIDEQVADIYEWDMKKFRSHLTQRKAPHLRKA